jgi:hypothetical protein
MLLILGFRFFPGADLRRRAMTRVESADKIISWLPEPDRVETPIGREAQRDMELIWLTGRLDKLLHRGR